MSRSRHYLDHAATGWPKPPGVLEACVNYQQNLGAAYGRGVYRSAFQSEEIVSATRANIASMIGAKDTREIGFTLNGTHSLNAALLGLLRSPNYRNSHVITTVTEHNSVLRPLQLLQSQGTIDFSIVPCDSVGLVPADAIRKVIRTNTKLIVINHVSNVTGVVQDLATIANLANEHGLQLMVDAAQSLGHLPIDVVADGIGILAAPGHKGACGMLGTGILYVQRQLSTEMIPAWIGGTGSLSDSIEGPFDWFESLESGNLNLPGIASLGAGIQWLSTNQIKHQKTLEHWTAEITEAILASKNLRLIGPPADIPRLGVFSLVGRNSSCHEMATLLDSACGIEARSGFHCAGAMHTALGTHELGGTLRLSIGHTSTRADIDATIEGIQLLDSL